ncbi:hypothetical protein MXB_4147 [Myxobolus squamalis]|nr:hypothetical protein MXB_4147 [Myxobolus squamalis]
MHLHGSEGFNSKKAPVQDPIFGEEFIFSIKSIINDLTLGKNAQNVHLNDQYDLNYIDNDSLCLVETEFEENCPDMTNPFLTEEESKETQIIDSSVMTADLSDDSLFEKSNLSKSVKIIDWIEKTDKEYLDSILAVSTVENNQIHDNKFAINSLLRSSFKNLNIREESDTENLDIKLVQSFNVPGNKENVDGCSKHKKNKLFSSFMEKKTKSKISKKKTSLWSRFFKRNKSTNLHGNSQIIQKQSLNTSLNSNQQEKQSDPDSIYYFVYYYLDELVPFRSIIPSSTQTFTLYNAKNLIPGGKNIKLRFFFKKITTSEGVDQIIYDEISDNATQCPFIGNEIICKVFMT